MIEDEGARTPHVISVVSLFGAIALLWFGLAFAAGDANRGVRIFQACAACHSMEPGRNMTGPSLAGIWGRKAGTQPGFHRYSEPLTRSGIVWREDTLDRWLTSPEGVVPGTLMQIQGLQDRNARADLIAFLHAASEGKAPAVRQAPRLPALKKAPQEALVVAVRYCRDTYFVTNGRKETRPFWEFNLRFKTDSTANGPEAGKPVMVGQGMQGDRAQIVFAAPHEISEFIKERC